MAATSGRVPIALLAAVTATSRVRGPIRSAYCASGSSPVTRSTSAHLTVTPPPPPRRHPRPHVRVMTEPGHHDVIARGPAPGQGVRDPVGERGRAGPEDH